MEANKTSSKAHSDGAKMSEKLFNGSTGPLMDMYTKQLNMYTGLYTNLLNSMQGNRNGVANFSNVFFKNNSFKPFWYSPTNFPGFNFPNPFLTPFEGMYKQMTDYNKNLLTSFNNELKRNWENGVVISKEYEETIKKRLDVSKKITETVMEGYNKQMDFAIENNNKMVAEISGQFNALMKQNQKLWTDWMGTYVSPMAIKEKPVQGLSGDRKKSGVLIHA